MPKSDNVYYLPERYCPHNVPKQDWCPECSEQFQRFKLLLAFLLLGLAIAGFLTVLIFFR